MKGTVVALAAVSAAGLALAWVADGARGKEGVYPPGSMHDTSGEGLSLARAYLRAKGARVEPLTRPLAAAPPPPSAVVLRVEPQRGLDGTRGVVATAREEEWVRGGGRLVIASATGWGGIAVKSASGRAESVLPGWPDFEPPSAAVYTRPPAGAHALAVIGEAPALMRLPIGRGEVILLAAPAALSNRGLAEPGNLALLERLAAGRDPVVFDEESHGLGHSLGVLDVLLDHGLGPALVLGVLATAAGAARARIRLGPPEPEAEDTRSDAVDLVASLGRLYGRAVSRADALRLYREAYGQAVRQSTGLSGRALQDRARTGLSRAGARAGASAAEPTRGQLEAEVRAINEAFVALRRRAPIPRRPER